MARALEVVHARAVIKPTYATVSLTNVSVDVSNNIIASNAFYRISFTTSTEGNLATIEMTFPSGFDVSQSKVMQESGTGGRDYVARPFCSLTISGQTIVCDSGMPVGDGTDITILLSGIVNGASKNNQVSILTREHPSGIILDGPTNSATFTLTQITNSMLGTNSVTG